MSAEHITIREIAKHFGVSTATISKALNDKSGVGEDLRRQILKYAEESNYVPDPQGRGLKGKGLKTIGVVITDITNPFYSSSIQSITNEAEKNGYNVILCDSQEDCTREAKQIENLIRRKIDGLIIVPSSYDSADTACRRQYARLCDMKIPFVFLQRVIEDPIYQYDCVKCDNVYGAKMAIDYLFSSGHTQVHYLTGSSKSSSIRERNEGVSRAFLAHGLSPDDHMLVCNDLSYDGAYAMLKGLIQEGRRLSAVFCAYDNMAFGAINAIRDCSLRVPEDIAVMGFDDNFYSRIFTPPLTTIRQETVYMAKRATELLMEKMETHTTAGVHEVVVPTLVKRESA